MTVGEKIKQARKAAGMTQKVLGDKLGIAPQSVAQWENDLRNPKYETLKRIAAALGVEWTDLVPEDEQGATITAHVIEKAGLTLKDENGNTIIPSDRAPWRKLSEAEAHRAGFIQFKSDEDRIAFFYNLLNTDGKLVASRRMYQSLDPAKTKDVADYMEQLSEIPQYQRHTPVDTPEGKGPTPAETPPQAVAQAGEE